MIQDFVMGSTAARPSDIDPATETTCHNCGAMTVRKDSGAVVHVGTWKATCASTSRARGRVR